MTYLEEFLFLAKRYKEQAEEDVRKWTAHIEKYEKGKTDGGAKLQCMRGLAALKAEAKLYIDANVHDGEDRSGAVNDRATFNPDELQELIDDLLEHLSS